MLQIGLPLPVLGTPAMFFFERGSTPRWLISKFALWGWALVLLAVALYVILQILQSGTYLRNADRSDGNGHPRSHTSGRQRFLRVLRLP